MQQSREPYFHAERDLDPADRELLAHPDELTIFRLEPDADRSGFHGCRTTKSARVTTASVRKRLFGAVDDSIRESDGRQMICFRPRHGITARRGARTIDLLICFECQRMYVYGDHPRVIPISSGRDDALEAAFEEAGEYEKR